MDLSYIAYISPPSTLQRLLFLPSKNNHRIINSLPLSYSKRLNSSFSAISTSASSGRSTIGPKDDAESDENKNDDSNDASSQAKKLRKLLGSKGIHLGPACFDALGAKLVERAGFDFCFTTGFGLSAAQLGLPDTGLISYGEMVDQGERITQAVSIPVIGDGDNGYGNAMNVKRTVKGYIRAGFAGIILEDQVSPKACGHTRGRKVVSRDEAVMKIKAAVDARKESGSDIVIVARTDSRQAVSLEESLWRSRSLADAGADILFIDALESKEEMKAFCEVYPLIPKMVHLRANPARGSHLVWGLGKILCTDKLVNLLNFVEANMLEGGGKTPIFSPIDLEEIGYKLVAYPLSLLGVSIRSMQDALVAIRGGRMPSPGSMPTFEEMKEILGFNYYYEEEKLYATKVSQIASQPGYPSVSNSIEQNVKDGKDQKRRSFQEPSIEVFTPEVYHKSAGKDYNGPFSGIWSRKLRVKITGRDGFEKLDIQLPAGFLEGITNIVPALGSVNIKALLDDAALEEEGKLLLDFNDTRGDRIQVFLE